MALIVVTSVGAINSLRFGAAGLGINLSVIAPTWPSETATGRHFAAPDLSGRHVAFDFIDFPLPNPHFTFAGPLMSTGHSAGGPEQFGYTTVVPTLEAKPGGFSATEFGCTFVNDAAIPLTWLFDFVDLPYDGTVYQLTWNGMLIVSRGLDSSVFGSAKATITDQLKLEEGIPPTFVAPIFRIANIRPLVFNFVEC